MLTDKVLSSQVHWSQLPKGINYLNAFQLTSFLNVMPHVNTDCLAPHVISVGTNNHHIQANHYRVSLMSATVIHARWIINCDWYFLATVLGNVIVSVCVLATVRGENLQLSVWEVFETIRSLCNWEHKGMCEKRWRAIISIWNIWVPLHLFECDCPGSS